MSLVMDIINFYAGRLDFNKGQDYNLRQYNSMKYELNLINIKIKNVDLAEFNTNLQFIHKFSNGSTKRFIKKLLINQLINEELKSNLITIY